MLAMIFRGEGASLLFPLAAIIISISTASLAAEIREWKTADERHSLESALVSQDPDFIELRTPQGQNTTVRKNVLCAEDLNFLKEELLSQSQLKEIFPKDGPFSNLHPLRFGTTRDEVFNTLNDIPKVKSRGNGSYSLKIGAERFELFLDFSKDDRLSEVNLWSRPHPEEEYRGQLENKWRTLSGSIAAELESADLSLPTPMPETLEDDAIQSTHIWDLPGQSFCLDVCKARGGYAYVFRSRRESYLIEAIFSSGERNSNALAATAGNSQP